MIEGDPAKVPPNTDELVGTSVGGKYQIVQRVARGGMSRIYLAIQEPLGRRVALKTFDPRMEDPREVSEFRERFLREAATVARLRHPNTVMIHDYGVIAESGSLYMAMEWIEGRNLYHVIREEGPLPPERAVRIAYEVARSLQEAHELGIIHRDVKSANVMLTSTGEGETVKVIDFGIAKEEDVETMSTGDRLLGTARYMSPEQISRLTVDGRSDLYSLGVVLFEMLTGQPLFKATTSLQTMMAHVKEAPPSLKVVCPNPIPDSLARVVDGCLAKRPENRPPSAHILRHQLHMILVELAGAGAPWGGDTVTSVHRTPMSTLNTSPTLARRSPASTRSRSPLVLLALFVTGVSFSFAFMGVGLVWVAAGMPLPSLPGAGAAPAPVEGVLELAEPVSVDLIVESTPIGAEVWEGGRTIGNTPLSLPLASGEGSPIRHLELRLDGYESEIVVQGPSSESVVVRVPLRPAAPAPEAPVPPKPRKLPPPPGVPDGPFMLER